MFTVNVSALACKKPQWSRTLLPLVLTLSGIGCGQSKNAPTSVVEDQALEVSVSSAISIEDSNIEVATSDDVSIDNGTITCAISIKKTTYRFTVQDETLFLTDTIDEKSLEATREKATDPKSPLFGTWTVKSEAKDDQTTFSTKREISIIIEPEKITFKNKCTPST